MTNSSWPFLNSRKWHIWQFYVPCDVFTNTMLVLITLVLLDVHLHCVDKVQMQIQMQMQTWWVDLFSVATHTRTSSLVPTTYMGMNMTNGVHILWVYTKYCIYCHMVFYVTIITFWMRLLMNMFTSDVPFSSI